MIPDIWSESIPYTDLSWIWQCLVIATLFYMVMRLKKGRGTVKSLLTVQEIRMRNSLFALVSNISLSTHENLQAAKEKQNIPTKSHSSAATDVEKHQACVSELDQQILKQHHLPLDCWEDWWRAQTMLRWSTETWMDTIRKTALRKLGQVTTLNTSHCRHRHDVRRRREAVTGKAYDSFLSLSHFSVVPPSKQINAVAQEEYYSPFSLRELLPFFFVIKHMEATTSALCKLNCWIQRGLSRHSCWC